MESVRTGVMATGGAASAAKVDILEDDGTEIILLKQYLDLLASAGSTRFAVIECNCVILVVMCWKNWCRDFTVWFGKLHNLFWSTLVFVCDFIWHFGTFSCMSDAGKWLQLMSFRDDKTKIKDFAEKICSEQYADQWVTKFHMTPDMLDKLVDKLRPFVKTMQGRFISTLDIW